MKNKIYALAFLLVSSLTVFGQAPNWAWAKSVGGTGYAISKSITTDSYGDSYVTGVFSGDSISIGNFILINNDSASYDIFIAKYDSLGNVLWAKSAGGNNFDMSSSITLDYSGNPYISGWFNSDTITFGSSIFINTGYNDIFIVKYDTSGNVIWSKSATGSDSDIAFAIAVDSSGNCYFSGTFESDTISIDNLTVGNTNSPFFQSDIFIAKLDSSGNAIWLKSIKGIFSDNSTSIAVDAKGNSFLTGALYSPYVTIDLDTIYKGSPASKYGFYVAKFDSSGNLQWAKNAMADGNVYCNSISLDSFGNTFLTGSFENSYVKFDNMILTNNGSYDIFTVKLNTNGNAIWAHNIGGTYSEESTCIKVEANGNSVICGYFSSPSFVFGSSLIINPNGIGPEIFVAKYDSLGNSLWAKGTGGANGIAYTVSLDNTSNPIVSGNFTSTYCTFDNTTIYNSNNDSKFFISKLDTAIITGLNESTNRFIFDMSISPNPTTSQINITSTNAIDAITISNPLGQVVYQSKPTGVSEGKKLSLQLKDAGIYFVTITSNKQITTRKIIVQH